VYGNKPVFPKTRDVQGYLQRREKALGHMSEQDYQEEFGNIMRYDLLISGMSALEGEASIVKYYTTEEGGNLEARIAEENVCGDLASHLLTEDGSIPRRGDADCPWAADMNSRALSLWPEDLAQVAQIHRDRDMGGTLLVCSGQQKAKPLLVALTKLHAANEICVDTNLAWKLLTLLGVDEDQLFDSFSSLQALNP
jgi:DNA-binding transcriptional regulator LsrR (DeoR family)